MFFRNVYTYCITPLPQTVKVQQQQRKDKKEVAPLSSKFLYDELSKFLHNHVTQKQTLCKKVPESDLLHLYATEWSRFRHASKLLHHVFGYLNRHWIKSQRETTVSNNNLSGTVVAVHDVLLSCR